MSISNLGKFFHLMDTSNISKHDTIHEDILWYLMKLTDVERITSIKSLEVFLERYFLISEIEVASIALDFIDSGSLISGVVSSHPFNFTVKDLLNFIGFSISDFPYDIYGTDKSFIERYEFKPPNVKISEGYNGVDLSGDAYLFQSVGVYTLLEIDSLNLRFKTDINSIHPNETIKIKEFVKYVISQVDESIFDNYIKNFGHLLTNFKPLFNPDLTVKFNPVKDLNRDRLFQIYEEFIRSDVNRLQLFDRNLKGELTIVISEKNEDKKNSQILSESDKDIIKEMINKLSIKEISKIINQNSKVPKKTIYNFCLKIKNEN